MGAKAGRSCQIDLDSLPSQFVKGFGSGGTPIEE
jgi:hypothetical protein